MCAFNQAQIEAIVLSKPYQSFHKKTLPLFVALACGSLVSVQYPRHSLIWTYIKWVELNTFIINKLWRIGKFQYHYKMPMLIHNIDTCVYYMFVFTCMSRDLQTHTFQHLHLAKVHIYKAYYHIRCRHTCGLIFTSLTSSKCILDIQ